MTKFARILLIVLPLLLLLAPMTSAAAAAQIEKLENGENLPTKKKSYVRKAHEQRRKLQTTPTPAPTLSPFFLYKFSVNNVFGFGSKKYSGIPSVAEINGVLRMTEVIIMRMIGTGGMCCFLLLDLRSPSRTKLHWTGVLHADHCRGIFFVVPGRDYVTPPHRSNSHLAAIPHL